MFGGWGIPAPEPAPPKDTWREKLEAAGFRILEEPEPAAERELVKPKLARLRIPALRRS